MQHHHIVYCSMDFQKFFFYFFKIGLHIFIIEQDFLQINLIVLQYQIFRNKIHKRKRNIYGGNYNNF